MRPGAAMRAGAPMTDARGTSLLELLVALGCTALVAAAVLPLVVGSSRLGRDRMERADAGSAAAAAAAAVAGDLGRVGVGFEGATAARRQGTEVPLVEAVAEDGVKMLLARGEVVEVATNMAGGRATGPYRAARRGGLAPGSDVVAIGSPGAGRGEPVPLGEVVEVVSVASGDVRIRVAFAAPEVAYLEDVGAPRALVPVVVRQYGTRPAAVAGLWQLWRRDDGGPRQPVADDVTRLRLEFYRDLDGDGVAEDGPTTTIGAEPGSSGTPPAAGPGAPGRIRAARVSVGVTRARPGGDGAAGHERSPGSEASVWVAIGGSGP